MIYRIYGYIESDKNLALGVSFSLINSFIILSQKNRVLMASLGFFLGLMLILSDLAFSLPLKLKILKSLRFPLAFFAALYLFGAEMHNFAMVLALYSGLVIGSALFQKTANNFDQRTTP